MDRSIAPAARLSAFVLLDVRAEFAASADDPRALYFGGRSLHLGILLVAAGVECGLRRARTSRRTTSMT